MGGYNSFHTNIHEKKIGKIAFHESAFVMGKGRLCGNKKDNYVFFHEKRHAACILSKYFLLSCGNNEDIEVNN